MTTPETLARALRRALNVEDLPHLEAMRPKGAVPLLSPRRLEIVLTAAAYPGIHLRSAARLLLSSLAGLRFHVARLAARGIVRTVAVDRRVCLFVPSLYRASFEPLLARWADSTDRTVLEALRSRSPQMRGDLPEATGLREGALDRSFARLRSAGAIRTHSTRHGIAVVLAPPWRRLDRECAEGVDVRLRRFVDFLAREGLRPSVDGRIGDRARLSVDGPRGRVRFALPLNPLTRDRSGDASG